MDNRPIGIFDSGFGGLTAYAALRRRMPEENFIFFADSARAPYGARSREELRVIARQDLDFVAGLGVKAILAACGTVSANAPEQLAACPVPTVGVLEDSVRVLSALPGDEPLGLIATAASVRSGRFQQRLRELCPGRELLAVPCPDFVTLIESGHFSPEDSRVQRAVEEYLAPLKGAGVRALLLGCTHYGLISRAIVNYMGPDTRLISAADCAAEALCRILHHKRLEGCGGTTRFLTSGSVSVFEETASVLLGYPVSGAESVPIMTITEGT